VKLDYGVAKLSSQLSSNISNELLYQFGRELNDELQQPYSAFTNTYLQGTGTSAGNVPEVSLAASTSGFYLGSPYYSYRKALPDEHKCRSADVLYMSHRQPQLQVRRGHGAQLRPAEQYVREQWIHLVQLCDQLPGLIWRMKASRLRPATVRPLGDRDHIDLRCGYQRGWNLSRATGPSRRASGLQSLRSRPWTTGSLRRTTGR